MPTLPEVTVTLLLPFEHVFDPRTWRKAQLLVVGAIRSPGKRTVSSALNILGIGQHGDCAVYHQALNRARWSPLQWYALHWQAEVTFEELRARLGMETQRQWSDEELRARLGMETQRQWSDEELRARLGMETQRQWSDEELRARLGMETQRQWSDRAIARTTPALFGLFSVVTLAADVLIEQQGSKAPWLRAQRRG